MSPEDNRMICIVNYIMQSFIKHIMAQEISKERGQALSSLKVTIKPNNSENTLANNKLNSHKQVISAKFLLDLESNIPVIHFSKSIRKVFCKRKQGTNNIGTVKK